MFRKYQHIERLGTVETEGILDGYVHVFYKIDGTNGSVWFNPEKGLRAGSRNRELSLENDNAGFCQWVQNHPTLPDFFKEYPDWYLYGEWLVPHSLKTYRESAWRDFYVFDIVQKHDEDSPTQHIPYDIYKPILEKYNINYIPPLASFKNPTEEHILKCLEKTGQFLVEDGKGNGEGLVVKNYDWRNKFGRQTWAKMISNEFKEKHHKEMGAPLVNGTILIEEKIVDEFLTKEFILKEKAKVELENSGWSSNLIPQVLGRVFYEFVREETWNFIKKNKNPKINFSLLNTLVIRKTKEVIL